MAKATTPRKPKTPVTATSLAGKIANGSKAAVQAVLELISPKLGEVDGRLDVHDAAITAVDARLAAIEADPTSPDELVNQLVRDATPDWVKLLK